MGDAGRDVNDVSCVQDDFFSAVDAGTEGFSGSAGAAVGMLCLHGAAGHEGDCAFFDYDLVGEELMTLGFAGAGADYETVIQEVKMRKGIVRDHPVWVTA